MQAQQLATNPSNSTTKEKALLIQKQQQTTFDLVRYLPRFGFQNLVSDYTFLRFLQYFGDDIERSQLGYGLSPDYFESILNDDPYHLEIYPYLFTASSFYAGQPSRTVTMAEKGLSKMNATFPDKGYIVWRYKAIDEILFLNDISGAIQSLEIAAKWADQTGTPEAITVATVSRTTAQFLSTNPDSRIARASAWSNVLARAVDDLSRERAIAEIKKLGGEVTITEGGAVQVFLPKQD